MATRLEIKQAKVAKLEAELAAERKALAKAKANGGKVEVKESARPYIPHMATIGKCHEAHEVARMQVGECITDLNRQAIKHVNQMLAKNFISDGWDEATSTRVYVRRPVQDRPSDGVTFAVSTKQGWVERIA